MMITPALERLILAKLHEAGGNMLPQPTLWRDVNADSPTPVPRDLLAEGLRQLAEKQQIIGVRGDDFWRWRISAAGNARLQELNVAPREMPPTRRVRQARDEE